MPIYGQASKPEVDLKECRLLKYGFQFKTNVNYANI